jgi:hypothetical protein
MKQGVSTTPWGVMRRPRRAAVWGSFFWTMNAAGMSILDFGFWILDWQNRKPSRNLTHAILSDNPKSKI